MAKNKLNVLQIVLICVAVVGVILAIVGISIDWFKVNAEGSNVASMSLFEKDMEKIDDLVGFPIGAVRAFGIISLILAVAACAVMCLNSLGVIKVKWLYRVICAAAVIVVAVLAFVFALVYAGKYTEATGGAAVGVKLVADAGAYLLPIGAIISAVPLFLGKEKE